MTLTPKTSGFETAQEGASEELKIDDAAFLQLLASFPLQSPDPVLAFDASGRIIFFNIAAKKLAETAGKDMPHDLIPSSLPELIRACLADPGVSRTLESSSGARLLVWTVFSSVENHVAYSHIKDVTQERLLEEQLVQRQKMDAVGQLAGGIAHDFNNFLTVISTCAQSVQLLSSEDDETAPLLSNIVEACQSGSQLTQQLMDIGRRRDLTMEPIDMNAIVERMGNMLMHTLGSSIRLRLELESDPHMILGEAGRLEQIILNLAVNARDAITARGEIVMRTGNVHLEESLVHRNATVPPGSYVRLSVQDNGQGIPEELITRIFEPFVTSKTPDRGTGLGLSTVYGIVKQHNGFCCVDSRVGEGTDFSIYFPTVRSESESAE